MRLHSQTQCGRGPSRCGDAPSEAPTGFLAAWAQLVGARGIPTLAQRRGRKARVPLTQLLPALTFHVMQETGTLADHLFQLFREPLANSSWSDRRLRLPWEIFAELMRRALRPRATARKHREAFWRGWRLVALDGTQFSLVNTPQVTATRSKARTRRGRAAFAKITTAVLLEVGLHNPLAAAVGRQGESEWALAQRAAGTAAPAGRVAGRSLVWRRRLCPGGARRVSARGQPFLAARLPDGQAPRDQATPRWQSDRRPPRAGTAQSEPHRRVARGARDSRARGAERPAR